MKSLLIRNKAESLRITRSTRFRY